MRKELKLALIFFSLCVMVSIVYVGIKKRPSQDWVIVLPLNFVLSGFDSGVEGVGKILLVRPKREGEIAENTDITIKGTSHPKITVIEHFSEDKK